MSNIVETIKESRLHGLSEHGYAGHPDPGGQPADYTHGKALQTALTNGTLQCRSIVGYPHFVGLEPYTGDDTPIVNWINAFDITKVAWGTCVVADFINDIPYIDTPLNPTPNSVIVLKPKNFPAVFNYPGFFASGVYAAVDGPGGGSEFAYSFYIRTQVGIGVSGPPVEYMVLETQVTNVGGGLQNYALLGCESPISYAADFIVDLPLPPLILAYNPGLQSLNYLFGLVGALDTSSIPHIAPDVATWAANINGNYYFSVSPPLTDGPDWNPSLACNVPTGPPF